MKLSLFIKLNFLILAFIVVLIASGAIRKHGLPLSFNQMFDALPTLSGSVNWCETRVESLVRPEGYKIEQVKEKWFREDKSRREVNDLSVEKWLSQYCSVSSEAVQPSTAALGGFRPVLFVKFINDTVQAIARRADGTFLWKGHEFKSQELDQALDELGRIESSKEARQD